MVGAARGNNETSQLYYDFINILWFALGVVRSMHCNPDFPADILPVDVAMNAIIAAAWERGLKEENKDVDFRNIVSFIYDIVSW